MIINGIEEIYKPSYYTADEQISNVIRIVAEMKENVDGVGLEKAALISLKRYPYFAVKPEIEGNSYVNVENTAPFHVTEGITSVHLLTKESNYYPLAVQYEGKRIAIDISHALTDGRGFMPFVKTLLYYYILFTVGEGIASDDINTVDTPIFGDELGSPDERINYNEITAPLAERKTARSIFRLQEIGLNNIGNKTVHHLRINGAEFMKYTKSMDASPSAIMSAMMAKVIWSLSNTEKDLPVLIAVDHRPMLHNKHSYRLLSNSLTVIYEEKQKGWPLGKLCTVTRGSIMLQSDEQNILYYRKQMLLGAQKMNMLPSVKSKIELMKGRAAQSLSRYSYVVSYPGIVNLGEVEKFTDKLYALTDDVVDGGLSIEILSFRGDFYITFMQGFDDDRIINKFISLLDDETIEYAYSGKEALNLSKAIPEIS